MYNTFLVIGAPKAGTTWIYDNLRCHPDVCLPLLKSFQFFTEKSSEVRMKKLSAILTKQSVRKIFDIPRALYRPSNILWYCLYFFFPRCNDFWYRTLLYWGKKTIYGEISPSYITASPSQILHAKSCCNNSKIIIFLRDPVERVWSQMKLDYKNKEINPNDVPANIMIESTKNHLTRSTYIQSIQNWQKVFGKQNLLICDFKKISTEPLELLSHICSFLDIEFKESIFYQSAFANIFKGSNHVIPSNLKKYLEKILSEEISYYNQLTKV